MNHLDSRALLLQCRRLSAVGSSSSDGMSLRRHGTWDSGKQTRLLSYTPGNLAWSSRCSCGGSSCGKAKGGRSCSALDAVMSPRTCMCTTQNVRGVPPCIVRKVTCATAAQGILPRRAPPPTCAESRAAVPAPRHRSRRHSARPHAGHGSRAAMRSAAAT